MRKSSLLTAIVGASLAVSAVSAGPVRDWHDLAEVHKHVKESINEMEHARAANHYDMYGHGEKAEQLLRDAEHELHEAIEASRHAR